VRFNIKNINILDDVSVNIYIRVPIALMKRWFV